MTTRRRSDHGKDTEARTYGLRERRSIHRLRAEAVAARRVAARAGSPSASLAPLSFDQLIPTTKETPHDH